MPNLDGIIWQNPTVMESIAPIISDVTARMEATIKEKAKLDAALKAKADELAQKKKLAEMKAKEDAKVKQAELPTSVPLEMHPYDIPVIMKAENDFLKEIGEANIDIKEAHNWQYKERWNQIQQWKTQAKDRKMQWDAAWKAASEANPDDYEQDPKDYLLTKRLAEEKIIEEGFKQGKTAQEIYAGLDGALYGMPAKKPKDFEIQQALPSIPKRAITQQTRSETDKTGKKQSVTVEIPDPEWVSKIRQVYDNDTKIQELTDRYVTKNTDGTTNYEGIADFWGRYAQKEEITDSKTDVEPREKTVVVNTGGNQKGYSGGGKSTKKKRAELEYEPKGFNVGQTASTSFYNAEGSLDESIYKPSVEMINSGKTPVTLINHDTGKPLAQMPEEQLKKVGNNIQWIPINVKGELVTAKLPTLGIYGGKDDIVAVVPFAKYMGYDSKQYFYVPVTAIDPEYEIIDANTAHEDYIAYSQKEKKEVKDADEKEQQVAPKEKPKRKLK